MSYEKYDAVYVKSVREFAEVVGTLQNKEDWYNVQCKGYVFAVHEDDLSREA